MKGEGKKYLYKWAFFGLTSILLVVCLVGCQKQETNKIRETSRDILSKMEEYRQLALKQEEECLEEEKDTSSIGFLQKDNDAAEQQNVQEYRGEAYLTEENIHEVIEAFLSIDNENELNELVDLPLTENFYNKCLEKFPYIINHDEAEEFKLYFWGMTEENQCVCFCVFYMGREGNRREGFYNKLDSYYLVMDLKNNQIDGMDITWVEHKE